MIYFTMLCASSFTQYAAMPDPRPTLASGVPRVGSVKNYNNCILQTTKTGLIERYIAARRI